MCQRIWSELEIDGKVRAILSTCTTVRKLKGTTGLINATSIAFLIRCLQ